MTGTKRILVATVTPPIVLSQHRAVRPRRADPLPRLGRLAWLLAAFSLPVFGLAVADLVHREGDPRATQAAAPASPSGGAAAHQGAIPASRVGMAPPLVGTRQDGRV